MYCVNEKLKNCAHKIGKIKIKLYFVIYSVTNMQQPLTNQHGSWMDAFVNERETIEKSVTVALVIIYWWKRKVYFNDWSKLKRKVIRA